MDLSQLRSVGVAGLGLIGGSLVQALADRLPAVRRVGFDTDAAARHAAAGCLHDTAPSIDALLDGCDLVLLCQPMPALLALLPQLAQRPRLPVLSDVAGVKVPVLQAAAGLGAARGRFVGAHPIAGKAESGWAAAEPQLFDGRLVVLCPEAAEPGALRLVQALWQRLGARTVTMDAPQHDTVYAALSHLPQLLTWAYLDALAGDARLADSAAFAGPGFASFTRLGRSNPALWAGIALQNREALLQGLDRLDGSLAALRGALARRDGDALIGLFERARHCPVLAPA